MNTEISLTDGRHPNYVRLVANNSDQVDAAINVFAGRQVSRVFVVSESLDIPYCRELMDLFRRMGGRHLTIVGATDYHALDRSGIDRLAQQVRRAGATGVYLIGGPESTSGMLVRALRAVSPGMVIVAPDGMNPISAAISVAGDAARGMYVTSENPPNDLLPPTGRQWLHRFAATQLGGQVPTSSTLAAASAEVLLDAIARSHGGRGSVADALPTTDLPDSVIGPIRFTPRGDIEECAVSVYQIVGGTFFVPDVEADLQGAAFVQRAGCSRAAS
jgi:ABC-type branched-subunit amino acid transport system substrate-binding protein